ncbi:hypothetical protein [uncultured Limimaricola sp.]|uniref:hypothetical protein n=1 Tax=uncultured Limimaricola sp. TaxID=2211667 RepID=UPI0030F81C0C
MIAFSLPRDIPAAPEVVMARTGHVALLARDLRGLRLATCVEEGAAVEVGTPLLSDRDRPGIRVVSPAPGRVERIDKGYGRRIERILIRTRGGEAWSASATPGNDLRETLLAYGIWPEFRTRPFGRVPDPDSRPDAIFVDALGGPPAASVQAAQEQPGALARGLSALRTLTRGRVVLCQDGGAVLAAPAERLWVETEPTGRGGMGARVCRGHSVARSGEVWTIDCQPVIAIGRLLGEGILDQSRLVVIARKGGLGRLVRTSLGADLEEILRKQDEGSLLLLPETPFEARRWLGRFETNIAQPAPDAVAPRAQVPGAIVPIPALRAALPAGIRAIPLLRALSIGDAEAARRLGCLDLIEDDMRAATAICASGSDYGALLRRVLDELEAET